MDTKSLWHAAAGILAIGLVAGGGAAQTPDGQTPAEETACSIFGGATFGLCNAYCEAIDCDGDGAADRRACDRLRGLFAKGTGVSDLPCDCRAPEVYDAEDGCVVPSVRITGTGEAYGHHGACYGWNDCGDAQTCALWACQINGYSELVAYGASGPCTGFDVCHLFFDQTSIEWNWGNWCDVFGVTDIDCR